VTVRVKKEAWVKGERVSGGDRDHDAGDESMPQKKKRFIMFPADARGVYPCRRVSYNVGERLDRKFGIDRFRGCPYSCKTC
jgi:hypothetical protein